MRLQSWRERQRWRPQWRKVGAGVCQSYFIGLKRFWADCFQILKHPPGHHERQKHTVHTPTGDLNTIDGAASGT